MWCLLALFDIAAVAQRGLGRAVAGLGGLGLGGLGGLGLGGGGEQRERRGPRGVLDAAQAARRRAGRLKLSESGVLGMRIARFFLRFPCPLAIPKNVRANGVEAKTRDPCGRG